MKKLSTSELIDKKGDFSQLKKNRRNPVYLILDDIRSMYNIGSIFRTDDATWISKVYLCGITACPPRKEIEKTALKTIEFVPWQYCSDVISLVNKLKNNGVQICCLEQTKNGNNLFSAKFNYPIALIIGNEVEGVKQNVLDISDMSINIPMYGSSNSLNVTTATGIALYQIINRIKQ